MKDKGRKEKEELRSRIEEMKAAIANIRVRQQQENPGGMFITEESEFEIGRAKENRQKWEEQVEEEIDGQEVMDEEVVDEEIPTESEMEDV